MSQAPTTAWIRSRAPILAGWGAKPMRYWLPTSEVNRRLDVLGRLSESIGIQGHGTSTRINFDEPVPAAG